MQRTTVKHVKEMLRLCNSHLSTSQQIGLGERYGYKAIDSASGGFIHKTGLNTKEAYLYLSGMYTALRDMRSTHED